VHFKEITSIQDAIALHRKILAENTALQFNPEEEEEYEDSDGNKLNKKLYQDLLRQGLL
jgi:splicing factor 3A subunit 3